MKNNILEIIDFKKVDVLLEGFNKSTGFVTAIIDLEGNILSKSGWRQICTEFHRVNPETNLNCTISDTELARKLPEGEKYHFYQCLNKLVDVAVPIIIGGEHIANLFSGQFFFDEPDKEIFRSQAKKYGFDEKKYMEAVDNAPVVTKEEVFIAMDFLLNMTQLISDMSFQKLELTQLNQALLKSEERYSLVISASEQGIWDWNLITNEVFYSPQWKMQIGYSDDEIKNEFNSWVEHLHPDEKDACLFAVQSYLENPFEHFMLEFRFRHKDGTYRWIHNKAASVRNEEGKVIRVFGIHTDVTAQKQAEESLRKLSQAIEQSPTSVVITNLKGDIEYVNPKFSQTTGYSLEEAIGLNPRILKSGSQPDTVYQELWKLISAGKEWRGELHNKKKNGELFWETASISPIVNEQGVITHYLAVKEDISERKRIESALYLKMKELERFHNLTVDRELTMVKLKIEVNELLKKSGQDEKYLIVGKE